MPINFPSTTFQILSADQILASIDQRVLIVGQMLATGTAISGSLQETVGSDDSAIASLFGERSILAEMCREFRDINDRTALDVIALDDNAGATAATASLGFSGTATESGSINVEIAGYSFKLDIASGDTAVIVAGALETLIDLVSTSPYTAALNAAAVDLTATNGGTHANDWTIFVDGAVAGIAVSISGWSGGATDPAIATVLDVVGSKRYQTVVWPAAYGDATVADFLDERFNVSDDVLQGVAIVTAVGTDDEVILRASALNSQSMVIIASRAISSTDLVGAAHREIPDVVSARFAAVRSLRFTDDAPLSSILTTTAASDQVGSRALASLPYANTVIPNMAVIRATDQWTATQLRNFTGSGVAVIGPNRNFNAMLAGEIVTTYTSDAASNPDTSFKFLNTVDTVAQIRDSFFLNFRSKYAQTRLTDGDRLPGRDMANQASIEAFCEELYRDLADDALVQAGGAAVADFKDNMIVTVDVSTGRVTVDLAPLLVTQLRVIVGTITVNFGG